MTTPRRRVTIPEARALAQLPASSSSGDRTQMSQNPSSTPTYYIRRLYVLDQNRSAQPEEVEKATR